MANYDGYRVYAVINLDYARKLQRIIAKLREEGNLDDVGLLLERARCFEGSHYFEFEVDNLNNLIDPPQMRTPDDVEILTLGEEWAILDFYTSIPVRMRNVVDAAFEDIAKNLVIPEGESAIFAIRQSESMFSYNYDNTRRRAMHWVASRGPEGATNVTTIDLNLELEEQGFHKRMLAPFPTQWLNPKFMTDPVMGLITFESEREMLESLEFIARISYSAPGDRMEDGIRVGQVAIVDSMSHSHDVTAAVRRLGVGLEKVTQTTSSNINGNTHYIRTRELDMGQTRLSQMVRALDVLQMKPDTGKPPKRRRDNVLSSRNVPRNLRR